MPLDPQAQRVVEAIAALNLKPIEDSTPDEARESIRTRTAALGPFEDVAAVADHRVPVAGGEITVRAYSPGGPGPASGPRLLPRRRLGDRRPLHARRPLPVARQRRALRGGQRRLPPRAGVQVSRRGRGLVRGAAWIVANAARLGIDPRRVAVGGDSAGGNLATVVALMARERGGPALVHQVLIYPVTDHDLNTPSYLENATGYVLTREGMRWFWNHYLAREAQGQEPHASPLRAASLTGLPPALVMTAEYDPLRDEGEAYAARLRDAGVPVTVTRYAGMFHGFVRMTRILDKARTALDEIAGSLQKAFAAAP